jgi:pimeloyl-ACP methyl ester carboxylesterase
VAFVVLRVTPSRMPSEVAIDECLARMRADGRPAAEIQAALAHWRLYFSYVQTGEGWELLLASSRQAEASEWGAYVDQPQVPEHLDWWRRHHAFDVDATLRALRVPVLAIYGGRDPIAIPELNAAATASALEAAAVEHVVEVIDRADHALELPGMFVDEATGSWVWPRSAPRAREAVIEWIRTH